MARNVTSGYFPAAKSQSGFTLVEVIVGIVVSAIALTFLSTLFFSNAGRSAEPIIQIRAAEFGQALLEEIISKRFDEATPVGGVPACTTTCTAESAFGQEGETRDEFDDVDDYHDYCSPVALRDSRDQTPPDFTGFLMSVCVTYDGDYDGTGNDGDTRAKLITVEITAPPGSGLGAPIAFSAYKGNY